MSDDACTKRCKHIPIVLSSTLNTGLILMSEQKRPEGIYNLHCLRIKTTKMEDSILTLSIKQAGSFTLASESQIMWPTETSFTFSFMSFIQCLSFWTLIHKNRSTHSIVVLLWHLPNQVKHFDIIKVTSVPATVSTRPAQQVHWFYTATQVKLYSQGENSTGYSAVVSDKNMKRYCRIA